jgi:hypothetical protein
MTKRDAPGKEKEGSRADLRSLQKDMGFKLIDSLRHIYHPYRVQRGLSASKSCNGTSSALASGCDDTLRVGFTHSCQKYPALL